MCSIVGISEDTVIENDSHTGGAQYLLKHITKEFWEKVYEDSESIFCLLEDFNNDEQQKLIGNPEYMPKKYKPGALTCGLYCIISGILIRRYRYILSWIFAGQLIRFMIITKKLFFITQEVIRKENYSFTKEITSNMLRMTIIYMQFRIPTAAILW